MQCLHPHGDVRVLHRVQCYIRYICDGCAFDWWAIDTETGGCCD